MRRASSPSPPQTAEVAALNHDGEGVVRAEKTAFVPGALPGELITFRRTRRHRQHDEAELLSIERTSPDRVEPRCAHFGVCGGCALQHLAPEAQLAAKQVEVAENLARIGRVRPERWLEPLTGPVWQYRRRARLGAKFVTKRGRVLVGFRERSSPYIAALSRCEILAPPVDALIEPLALLLTGLQAHRTIPQIEVAVGDEVTVLVFRHLEPLSPADEAALLAFERERGVRVYLQPGGPSTVRPLSGVAASLRYRVAPGEAELAFEPTDFVQINAAINARLVPLALEQLEVGATDRVLDLFCGLGNFTLPLACRAQEVVGVEGDASLVARARENARSNGIENVRFHVANLFEADGGATALQGSFSRVLLDPPRAGALEVLPRLAALGAERIVYVSCHPGTLARDLGVLCHDHGYRLVAAGVIDMFPHTPHIESMAVLERAR